MTYTSVLALVILRLNAILEKIGNAEEIRIPMDLVVLILSHLSLKDNIRASSVCKAWHKAAVSVRRNSPWLVYFDHDYLTGFSFGFYDPTEKIKTRSILLPNQPLYASLCCSKDGWLLLIVNYQEDDPASLVFFNPFTRVYIILPRLIAIENFRADYAFSCAPTNESCVVCCIIDRTEDSFLIHTWDFGAVEWVTDEFHKPSPSKFCGSNIITFSDGCFWFLDEDGLGVFNPVARTWDKLCVPLPKPIPFLMWIMEYKGNIFLASRVNNMAETEVILFGLNRFGLVWEKKESFDGSSIFVSNKSSIMTNGLNRDMNNVVHVWYLGHLSKFSLSTRHLCTDFSINSGSHSRAWIEPPQDIYIYEFPIVEPN